MGENNRFFSSYQNKELVVNDSETNKKAIGKENIESLIEQKTLKKVQLISVRETQGRQNREADRSEIGKLGTVINQESLAIASNENRFFDVAPMHILTTSSLLKMKSFYAEGAFEVERFRPNLVIDTGDKKEFIENNWVGRVIKIGEELRIKIIDHCPRCVMTSLKQKNLEKDFKILRTIAQNNSAESISIRPGKMFKGVLGVYGVIERIGTIKIGDKVELEE